MQRLTNDKLVVNQKGEVKIYTKGIKNMNKKLLLGTRLISELLSNRHTTKIQIGDKTSESKYHAYYKRDAFNGKGTDGMVTINFSQQPSVLVRNRKTGNSQLEIMDNTMIVGHELIHAIRAMNGKAIDHDKEASYIYKETNGKKYETITREEELETVGIHGNSKYTENLLRVEHNLNQRIKY